MSTILPLTVTLTSHDLDPDGWTLRVSPFSIATEYLFSFGFNAEISLLEDIFMLIPIYYFDDEKYFAYEGQAQKLEDGSILMPDDATQVAPDAEKLATHFAKWNENSKKWEYEPKPTTAADFVGKQISHKSQSAHDIELRQLLQALVNADSATYRVIRGSEEEGLWWGVEKIPEQTLEELRAQKLSQLDSSFKAWYQDGATVTTSLGFVADSDSRAMMDVNGLVTTLEAQPAESRATVAFMDANNQTHLLDLEQLKTVQVEIIQNGQSAYQQKWTLRTAIETAQSKEDLEAIEIKFTAEDFSK